MQGLDGSRSEEIYSALDDELKPIHDSLSKLQIATSDNTNKVIFGTSDRHILDAQSDVTALVLSLMP